LIEFLSHLHLLIAVAPMLAMGYLAAFAGLYIVWRERRAAEHARREARKSRSDDTATEKPKAAHA
jgi:hypothetical protein